MVSVDASHPHCQIRFKAVEQSRGGHPWQGAGSGSSSCGREREAPWPHQAKVRVQRTIDSLAHYFVAPLWEHSPGMNLTILLEVTAAALLLAEVARQAAAKR